MARAKRVDFVFENSIEVRRYVCTAGANIDIKNRIFISGGSMLCELLA